MLRVQEFLTFVSRFSEALWNDLNIFKITNCLEYPHGIEVLAKKLLAFK